MKYFGWEEDFSESVHLPWAWNESSNESVLVVDQCQKPSTKFQNSCRKFKVKLAEMETDSTNHLIAGINNGLVHFTARFCCDWDMLHLAANSIWTFACLGTFMLFGVSLSLWSNLLSAGQINGASNSNDICTHLLFCARYCQSPSAGTLAIPSTMGEPWDSDDNPN